MNHEDTYKSVLISLQSQYPGVAALTKQQIVAALSRSIASIDRDIKAKKGIGVYARKEGRRVYFLLTELALYLSQDLKEAS